VPTAVGNGNGIDRLPTPIGSVSSIAIRDAVESAVPTAIGGGNGIDRLPTPIGSVSSIAVRDAVESAVPTAIGDGNGIDGLPIDGLPTASFNGILLASGIATAKPSSSIIV
jgi:hypothetical protein